MAAINREGNVDSPVHRVRRRAEESLSRELQFCSHLSLSAVMLRLSQADNANLSRIMYTFLVKNPVPQVWVRVPMNVEECAADVGAKDKSSLDAWNWWDAFRSAANYDKKLGVVLEISKGKLISPYLDSMCCFNVFFKSPHLRIVCKDGLASQSRLLS